MVFYIGRYLTDEGEHTVLYKTMSTYTYRYVISIINFLHITHTHTRAPMRNMVWVKKTEDIV